MHFSLISLFPEYFDALKIGITGRALFDQKITLAHFNPRDFSDNPHGYIDDRPYGGGPGMVMQAPPLKRAIHEASQAFPSEHTLRIHLSPTGQRLNQEMIDKLSKYQHLILLCGRYEGVDQRVIDQDIDLECSIGDYVLSGGEIAALVLMDCLIRQQPGVLGDENSYREDSFFNGLLDHPHYTRPKIVENQNVPDILLSGDHAKITQWRRIASEKLTKMRRPDLWGAYIEEQSRGTK